MDRNAPETTNADQSPIVYYDGACPLCRAEIGLYKRLGAKAQFCDVAAEAAPPEGISRAEALKRFHVMDRNGRVRSGARAFAELWKATPGWRCAGRIGALPPFVWIGEGIYRVFLLTRPALQALARRSAKAGSANQNAGR